MKHRLLFLSISLSMLTLIGCSVIENNEPIVNTDPNLPEFYIGNGDTKVTGGIVDGDYHQWSYNWTKGDMVAIYPGVDTKVKYIYEGETGATSGVLTGVSGGDFTFGGGKSLNHNIAVVPYRDEDISLDTDNYYLSLDFPQIQAYHKDGLGDNQTFMLDRPLWHTRNLFFRNVFTTLIVRIKNVSEINQPVYKINLTAPGGEKLWGKFYVDLNDDPVTETMDYAAKYLSGGGNTITLDATQEANGYVTIPPGETMDFYFSLPEAVYSQGLKLSVFYGTSSYSDIEYEFIYDANEQSSTLQRSHYYWTGVYEYSPVAPPKEYSDYVAYLLDQYDSNYDGELSDEEVEAVTYLDLDYITGFDPQEPGFELERFKNITELDMNYVEMESQILDFSPFEYLEEITIQYIDELMSVRFNNASNSTLKDLEIRYCPNVSYVDFHRVKNLEYIYIVSSAIENPDFTSNTKVEYFYYVSNKKTFKVDLSAMVDLEYLACYYNDLLSNVKLPKSKKLYHIDLEGCNLSGEIDLSYYTALEGSVYLSDNKDLRSVKFPKSESLSSASIYIKNTAVAEIDLSPMSNVVRLYAYNCPNLESINLEGCNNLYFINAYNNPLLKNLDISDCRDNHVTLYLYNVPSCETLTLIQDQLSTCNVDGHIEWIYID